MLDQGDGRVVWSFEDRIASAPAQILGSWSSEVHSFVWSWDNTSIADRLCETAATVRAFGAEHDIGALTASPLDLDEAQVRDVVALAFRSAADGALPPLDGRLATYIAFGEVTLEEAGGAPRPSRWRPRDARNPGRRADGDSERTVSEDDTAEAVGSGSLPVLGTPRLLAWCEAATCAAVAPCLDAGQTTVGTRISIEHLAPSPVGPTSRSPPAPHVDGLVRFSVAARQDRKLSGQARSRACRRRRAFHVALDRRS